MQSFQHQNYSLRTSPNGKGYIAKSMDGPLSATSAPRVEIHQPSNRIWELLSNHACWSEVEVPGLHVVDEEGLLGMKILSATTRGTSHRTKIRTDFEDIWNLAYALAEKGRTLDRTVQKTFFDDKLNGNDKKRPFTWKIFLSRAKLHGPNHDPSLAELLQTIGVEFDSGK